MARTPSSMLGLGTPAPAFDLPDTEGGRVALSDYEGQPIMVAFICNHCPFVIHIREGLAAYARDYADKGLGVVAIQSNDVANYPADAPDKMREEKAKAGYVFPYLFDESQSVAMAYHAACTPDFFLFDRNHRLVYRGQLDESRPGNGVAVTGESLRAASDVVLAGGTPDPVQLPSLGCNIKWKPGNEPKFGG